MTGLSPVVGGAQGGTVVTVDGSGFSSGSWSCRLYLPGAGGFRFMSATVVGDTQLTCVLPNLSALFPTVSNAYVLDGAMGTLQGSTLVGSETSFRVIDFRGSSLTSLSPTAGVTTAPTLLSLHGTNLYSSTAARCHVTSALLSLDLPATNINTSLYQCTLPALASNLLGDTSQSAAVSLWFSNQANDQVNSRTKEKNKEKKKSKRWWWWWWWRKRKRRRRNKGRSKGKRTKQENKGKTTSGQVRSALD